MYTDSLTILRHAMITMFTMLTMLTMLTVPGLMVRILCIERQ